jgi:hypothetical protein
MLTGSELTPTVALDEPQKRSARGRSLLIALAERNARADATVSSLARSRGCEAQRARPPVAMPCGAPISATDSRIAS